ncbi:MAG: hypothetical protein PVJ53_10115 [Desulfobacterales bacterium]|jgi:hypothetical protein
MLIYLPELDLMPKSVRIAVLLTFSGWCCFLLATYAFYDPDSFFKFAIAGGILCYYLYKAQRWARVIAMLSSVFIVLYGGFFAYLFASRNIAAMLISIANVVLFAAAFYYFMHPQSREFFKKPAPAETSAAADSKTPSEGED